MNAQLLDQNAPGWTLSSRSGCDANRRVIYRRTAAKRLWISKCLFPSMEKLAFVDKSQLTSNLSRLGCGLVGGLQPGRYLSKTIKLHCILSQILWLAVFTHAGQFHRFEQAAGLASPRGREASSPTLHRQLTTLCARSAGLLLLPGVTFRTVNRSRSGATRRFIAGLLTGIIIPHFSLRPNRRRRSPGWRLRWGCASRPGQAAVARREGQWGH